MKKPSMCIRCLFTLVIWLIPLLNAAQNQQSKSPQITENTFSGTLSFLSSGWMEGREAGERGSFLASDYIASMMGLYNLKPYGDVVHITEKRSKNGQTGQESRSYYQNFHILRNRIEQPAFSIITQKPGSQVEHQLIPDVDFEFGAGLMTVDMDAPIVFAGYGISAPDRGYDDYKKLEVNGCVVVVLRGFPGHLDSASIAAEKLDILFGEHYGTTSTKLATAIRKGALALIEVAPGADFRFFGKKAKNSLLLPMAMYAEKEPESQYPDDFHYSLPGDTLDPAIPLLLLSDTGAGILFKETGISLIEAEKKAAESLTSPSALIKGKYIRISIKASTEKILVRNVLGYLPGKDTTKNIVIGAHYDHLGIRNGNIYNGADDNASGTTGMLALANHWCEAGEQPPCNLVFAAWTAEEKGILGSRYYVDHNDIDPRKTLLCINMDMISRSAPEDTAAIELSVGTVKGSDDLKALITRNNQSLDRPFRLDLWECSEHGGSDYASFAGHNVPVMTFFSGFHEDYHTTQDISPKADLRKMVNVLNLVNWCLSDFMSQRNRRE